MTEFTVAVILGFLAGVCSCAMLVYGLDVWESHRERKALESRHG